MEGKELLTNIRANLDEIDDQIMELLEKRMTLIDQVSEAKRKENLPTKDQAREDQIMDRVLKIVSDKNRGEALVLMRTLLAFSKYRQRNTIFDIDDEPLLPPSGTLSKDKEQKDMVISYQGIPGAFGELAALSLYPKGSLTNEKSFEDVFKAVREGRTDYGVVPIENSRTGAIGESYDLLRKYGCYIVGQTSIKAEHCLLGLPGTKLQDIREIFSHREGLSQCSRFLGQYPWDTKECNNTAVAAKTVSDQKDPKFAAIGSKRAAELYGLEVLKENIMDNADNSTRFIAIGAQAEYDENSDRVSITFRTGHQSGDLCQVLFNFMAAGINLVRIESRPMLGEQFCFFADLEGNIDEEWIVKGLKYGGAASGYLEVLGCYPAQNMIK